MARTYKGCIYSELHNRGRNKRGGSSDGNSCSRRLVKGVGMVDSYKYRWVAEITIHGKRYRCRSAHYNVVRDWLNQMIDTMT